MKGAQIMSSVLTVEQREQAGSDSYNRFEYQVHWIVCHIIGKLQEDAECIVFCEFHDDMAEFSPDNQQYQFFQIKTKEESSDWTIAEMSKREKKKSGNYKKSFLGFIFYNHLVLNVRIAILYQIMILIKMFYYGSHILKTGKGFRQKMLRYMKKSKTGLKMNFQMICLAILILSLRSLFRILLYINRNCS